MYGDSIADKPSEPQDESLTTRTSTLATMMVDWIVLEATAQQKSKRCRSKRRLSWILTYQDKQDRNPVTAKYATLAISSIYHANMNRCTF
jgi:hypothetical protein